MVIYYANNTIFKIFIFSYGRYMKYKSITYSCVIFDLDGTLVNTIGDIARTMNQALVLHGFPPLPEAEYPKITGWGIKKLAFSCLPEAIQKKPGADETAEKIAEAAARFYTEKPLEASSPYPGITDLLAKLGAKRIKMAVLSNKPDMAAHLVVEGLFPGACFSAIHGEIKGIPRKPDPAAVWELLVDMDCSPSDTIFIGDSEIDMETARNAGCFPLGVSWGFRNRNILEEAGAKFIIDNPLQLMDFLK
jgi:phosphoglycolate phosphatase